MLPTLLSPGKGVPPSRQVARDAWYLAAAVFLIFFCLNLYQHGGFVQLFTQEGLSVIVVVQEGGLTLKNCLNALHQHVGQAQEVLVVDMNVQSEERRELLEHIVKDFPDARLLPDSKNRGWSGAVNFGLMQSRLDSNLALIITDRVEVQQDTLAALKTTMAEHSAPAAAAKLATPDGLLLHGGYEFGMAAYPEKQPSYYNYWQRQKQTEAKNAMLPRARYVGLSILDPRALAPSAPLAVSFSCALASIDALIKLKGADTTFGRQLYAEVDLALRLAGRKAPPPPAPPPPYGVVDTHVRQLIRPGDLAKMPPPPPPPPLVPLTTQIVGTHYGIQDDGSYDDEMTISDAQHFVERWGSAPFLKAQGKPSFAKASLVWDMECGVGPVMGFTTEALYFAGALDGRLPLKVHVSDLNSCMRDLESAGLPGYLRNMVHRLSTVNLDPSIPKILVIHRDAGRYPAFKQQNNDPPPAYTIGRSMFETDRIPSDWPENCNRDVDEIWVPSHFNVETFASSGVRRELLRVMPEPMDIERYDPAFVKPLQLPIKAGFTFLSVGKWEARKGYDLLLEAFFKGFSIADDVVLYIRSGVPEVDFTRKVSEIAHKVGAYRKDKWRPPAVHVFREAISYARLPGLYAAADAFVLPTHGEGWGLPLAEAMAMGLPVVTTNWSGITEFVHQENAFPVPVAQLAESHDIPAGHRWAIANVANLTAIMQFLVQHPEKGREIGQRARQSMLRNFSQKAVGERLMHRVSEIYDTLHERETVKKAEAAKAEAAKQAAEAQAKEIKEKWESTHKKIRINDPPPAAAPPAAATPAWTSWQRPAPSPPYRNSWSNYNFRSRLQPPKPTLKRKVAPASGQYQALKDACVEMTQGEYKYEVCFFDNVTQTSLRWNTQWVMGIWGQWENGSNMLFNNGDNCGSIERSTKVHITCSQVSEAKIFSITESSTCVYNIEAEVPSSKCTDHIDSQTDGIPAATVSAAGSGSGSTTSSGSGSATSSASAVAVGSAINTVVGSMPKSASESSSGSSSDSADSTSANDSASASVSSKPLSLQSLSSGSAGTEPTAKRDGPVSP